MTEREQALETARQRIAYLEQALASAHSVATGLRAELADRTAERDAISELGEGVCRQLDKLRVELHECTAERDEWRAKQEESFALFVNEQGQLIKMRALSVLRGEMVIDLTARLAKMQFENDRLRTVRSASYAYLNRVLGTLIARYSETFPNYEYDEPENAIDLMAEEIIITRMERDRAQAWSRRWKGLARKRDAECEEWCGLERHAAELAVNSSAALARLGTQAKQEHKET